MSLSISMFMFTIALCKHSAILKFKTLNAQVFRYSLALIIKNCHSNKRINIDTVTLSVILSHIAIKLQKDKFNRRSVCKKCARRATSTYNTFIKIREVLKKNGSLCSQVETPPSSPNAHGRKKRFNKSSAKDLVLDFDRFSA